MPRFVQSTDPQPVHGAPVTHAGRWHVPVRLTSHTNAPQPGPIPTVDTTGPARRGRRRLVRPVKGSS